MALTPPGANSRQVGEIAKAWRSPTLLSEVIARSKTILKVRFFAVADSIGSKGGSDSPSRTTARSQVGTLERAAGLILHAPRRKRTTSWCLPRGPTSKGAWKAAMAATYTFSVDGVRPAEKRSWRNSSTEATGQLTGSNPRSLHHVENTFHFKPYNLLVEGALELSMVSITPADKPASRYRAPSGARPTVSTALAEGEKLCPLPETADPSSEGSATAGLPGVTWCLRTIPGPARMGLPAIDWPLLSGPSPELPGAERSGEKRTGVASATSVPWRPTPAGLDAWEKTTVDSGSSLETRTNPLPLGRTSRISTSPLGVKSPFPWPQPLPRQDVCSPILFPGDIHRSERRQFPLGPQEDLVRQSAKRARPQTPLMVQIRDHWHIVCSY